MTLLFTDLVGSTGLLERLGDDAAEELRRAHFRVLRDAVALAGGEEVKSLGDGLMVAFASAVDALGCAVAVQQAVERQNCRMGEGAERLEVRVGLHVGEPIRSEDDYFGRPVVVARRLCDAARGGEIVLSALVRELVGSRVGFRFCDLDPLELKGLREPVAACALLWEPVVAAPLELPAAVSARGRGGSFVGRVRELERLRERFACVRGGELELVLIVGEPGVGKTRLAFELARAEHELGAIVLYGRCEEEALAAYEPFVQALSGYVSVCSADLLRALAGADAPDLVRMLPELARRLPGLAQPAAAEAEAERLRLFEAVARFLREMSVQAPVLLVLDDLHWAEKPTLLMLRHLVRVPGSRMMIVGIYRDSELARSHPLAAMLADLRRERQSERIALKGLDGQAARELVVALAGRAPPTVLMRAVLEETEGNPFFIGEIVRHLVESGALEHDAAEHDVVERLAIPEGVKEVIGRRLSRLGEAANQALEVAAVIGREFQLELLGRVSERTEDELADVLDEAVRAGVVEEGAVGRYSFAHALIRETLHEELTSTRCARLHLRVGEALELLHSGDADPVLGELAYHFCEAAPAGDPARAVAYARRAAEQAIGMLAYEEAATHYERALEVLELTRGVEDAERCELLLSLGEAQMKAGATDAARTTFKRAAALARQLRAPEAFARAALGFGAQFLLFAARTRGDPEFIELLQQALELMPSGERAMRADLLAGLARELYWEGVQSDPAMLARARALSAEAVGLARDVDDSPALAKALAVNRMTMSALVDPREELEMAREALELAEATGDGQRLTLARTQCVITFLQLGDIDGVEGEIAAVEDLAERTRIDGYLWYARAWQAMLATLQGRFADAQRLSQEAMTVGRAVVGEQNGAIMAAYQAMQVMRLQGRIKELAGLARFALEQNPIPAIRASFALASALRGHVEEARVQLDRLATDRFVALQRDTFWLAGGVLLAELCAELKDTERATVLYERFLPDDGYFGWGGPGILCYGAFSRSLGQLAATAGRCDDAQRHFEAALRENERTGARPYVATTQRDYARMLLGRGRPGDREHAMALLEEALTTARELGLAHVEQTARMLHAETVGAR